MALSWGPRGKKRLIIEKNVSFFNGGWRKWDGIAVLGKPLYVPWFMGTGIQFLFDSK